MMDKASKRYLSLERVNERRSTRTAMIGVVYTFVVVLLGGLRQMSAADVRYEVKVEKDVMVAMRDGVKLATDVYLPAKGGRGDRRPLSGGTRPHAVRQIRNECGARQELRPFGLRGRWTGHARPRRIGRNLALDER